MDTDPNQITKDAWEAHAEVWDTRMGDDGNDFFDILCGQTKPQLYFERPLQYYMNLGFQNVFVVDGFEERAFPPEHPQDHPLGWGGKFSEIPPALVMRMRLA